jgi:O-methyltransferase involved in polyketide biosynthesis
LADVSREAGYQWDQKTLFLWEGVGYYLEVESLGRDNETLLGQITGHFRFVIALPI